MKSIIVAFIISIIAFSTYQLHAQIKIGELNGSSAIITHDKADIIQALEKEYDSKQETKFLYAKILVSKNNRYWLAAGNGNPETQFKIAVELEKSPKNNDLFIMQSALGSSDTCVDCDDPSCALKYDGKGNPDGCTGCGSGYTDQHCNHNKTAVYPEQSIILVERYLLIKK